MYLWNSTYFRQLQKSAHYFYKKWENTNIVFWKTMTLCWKSIKEPEDKFKIYYGDDAPSHHVVHKWFTEFCCGHTSMSDARHSGCQSNVTNEEIVNKIHDIIWEDHWLKVCEIANMVNIATECVCILHKHLDMRKLLARWLADSWLKAEPHDYLKGMFGHGSL